MLAGPFAALLVAGRAGFIEPTATPTIMTRSPVPNRGVTVVVPVSAVGAIDVRMLDRLSLSIAAVDLIVPVPYELSRPAIVQAMEGATNAAIAEAVHRFGRHPLQVIKLPGHPPDAIARWAVDHAPAVIVTTSRAQPPRSLGRLARLIAERPGLSLVVLDPTALTPEATANLPDGSNVSLPTRRGNEPTHRCTQPQRLGRSGDPTACVDAAHDSAGRRRTATVTCVTSGPRLILSEERTEPGPAPTDRRPTRGSRRFVFEPPTQDVIDELCRIDLR